MIFLVFLSWKALKYCYFCKLDAINIKLTYLHKLTKYWKINVNIIIKFFVSNFVVLESENRLFFTFTRSVLKILLDLCDDRLVGLPFWFLEMTWDFIEKMELPTWKFLLKKTVINMLCWTDVHGVQPARNRWWETMSLLNEALTLWQFLSCKTERKKERTSLWKSSASIFLQWEKLGWIQCDSYPRICMACVFVLISLGPITRSTIPFSSMMKVVR